MANIIEFLKPPKSWIVPVILLLGVFAGMSIYLFIVSNAASYLSDDPKTCVNCHVMAPQYATWKHSSHRENATCVDCHIPHDNIAHTYLFKMQDGMRHAKVFTMREEPQVIFIKEDGVAVVQENCKRCHETLNDVVGTLEVTGENYEHGEGKLCWECHREVPHGRVNSLSSTPNALVPYPESPVPDWMDVILNK